MEPREVLCAKSSKAADSKSEGVTQGQHDGCARAGGQSQMVGFFDGAQFENYLCRSGKLTLPRACHGDDWDLQLGKGGRKPDHLLCFATCREKEPNIAEPDATEIPVKGLCGMKKMAGRSRRCKRCRDFLPDQAGFTHSRNHNMTPTSQ